MKALIILSLTIVSLSAFGKEAGQGSTDCTQGNQSGRQNESEGGSTSQITKAPTKTSGK